MTNPTHDSAAFTRNAQAALKDATFEDILTALVMKLQERGVFDEEAAEKAWKVNSPLAQTFLRTRDQQRRDRAWDTISARIFQLGGLLPPEDADGAFLADRTQVKALLDRRTDLWAQKVVEETREQRDAFSRHADEQDEDRSGDVGAGPPKDNIFDGLGENDDFFRYTYWGKPMPSEGRDEAESPRSRHDDTASTTLRAVPGGEASPSSQSKETVMPERPYTEAFYQNVMIASNHTGPLGILMALSVRLIQLGVPGVESIREAEEANFAVVDTALNPKKVALRRPEEQERALDAVANRGFQLGSLLPPEDADGAFLASKEQVQALVAVVEYLKVAEAKEHQRERKANGMGKTNGSDAT
jgi:hypothetical protein